MNDSYILKKTIIFSKVITKQKNESLLKNEIYNYSK